MTRSRVSGHFVDSAKGRIFLLAREPQASARGAVLVVPPFAEEMNKCRRMVTEVAIALEHHGFATLVPDLHGTGDSEGDFADADWSTWRADIAAAAHWGAMRGYPVAGMIAIRLGAGLAVDCVASGVVAPVARTVLWQPILDGERFLGQFLRLRIAAGLMDDRRETLADLKARLTESAVVDVAGYGLSGQLASGLGRIRPPSRLPDELGDTVWIELVRDQADSLPLPASRLIEASGGSGSGRVRAVTVQGEPYWSATEIVVNDAIVAATAAHFAERS